VTRDRTREIRAVRVLALPCPATPWTSVVLLKQMPWHPRGDPRLLQIVVSALQPQHQPFPSHRGHAPPTRFPDPPWSPPQSLQVCPLTGRLRGACAIHRTQLLVPNVERGGIVTLALRMGSAHHPDVLCASRAFTRGDFSPTHEGLSNLCISE
jgi:hypothetical protein